VRVGFRVITDRIYRQESHFSIIFKHLTHFRWLTDLLNRCNVIAAALSHWPVRAVGSLITARIATQDNQIAHRVHG
jgi:hypothetical protein